MSSTFFSGGGSDEQLQEKTKCEKAFKLVQRDLKDILNLNDEIVNENKKRDDTIAQQEQRLIDLQLKNVQFMEQLRLVCWNISS